MAMRSRTTFKKRQKELARQEKQRDKVARRLQRKMEKGSPESGDELQDLPEDGEETLDELAPAAGVDTHTTGDAQ